MIRILSLFFLSAAFTIACSRNTVTGRNQFKLFSEADLQQMSAQQYSAFLAKSRVINSTTNKDAEMVRRVGQRITKAVEEYYSTVGKSNELAGYKWEYNLVEDKAVNAWCMSGGKIVVYTGLLPMTQNEAALAIVMGHEVSHAIFQHGNERMSQQMGAEIAAAGLQAALINKPVETQNAFLLAYGIGAQTGVLLPFSRKHELEADRFGMRWAAIAGYNPQEAIPLWQRMENASKGQSPPEFLSTHPSEENRIAYLQKYMDEALKYYKPMTN